MSPIVKTLIEKYISLIDTENWLELFRLIISDEDLSYGEFLDFINALNMVGIDTTDAREYIFMVFFEDFCSEADDWMAPEDIVELASNLGCLGIDYNRRCELIIDYARKNPTTIDWHWDVRDHSSFEVLYIGD